MAHTEQESVGEVREAGVAAAPLNGRLPAAGRPDRSRGSRLLGAWRRIARATLDNPVLVKEFRTRMRGARAYWVLLGYTLFLAGVVAMMYFAYYTNATQQTDPSSSGSVNMQGARELGRAIYYFVFIAQAIMVALITPAITAGALTIEREQRSYELLVTTPLRSSDVVRGKLTAAVSFVVLLLTASVPLVSLSFLVGGVSPAEIAFSYLLISLGAFVYGALGIFWSSALASTAAATVVTYLTVFSLFILTVIPGMDGLWSSGGPTPDVPFKSLNPLTATLHAVHPEYLFNTQIPSWISAAVLNLLLGMLITNAAMARLEHFEPPRPFWTRLYSTLLWCAFGLFLFGAIFGSARAGWSAPDVLNRDTGIMLVVMLVLISLVTPVFNSGDLVLRRGGSALRRYVVGMLPHRMFAGDLSCGIPLIVLWSLFLFALIPAGVHLAGKASLFNPGAVWVPGMVLCMAVALGLAGVGNFLSVMLPSRWAACVLTYLVGVMLMLFPYFTLFFRTEMVVFPKTPEPLWQILYLIPFEGLAQLRAPAAYRADRPPLLFDPVAPVWVVTASFYLTLAAVSFFLAAWRIRWADKRVVEAV
jgi:ABC-type transport system involved in multi-copper enzyme maturation permease subunit